MCNPSWWQRPVCFVGLIQNSTSATSEHVWYICWNWKMLFIFWGCYFQLHSPVLRMICVFLTTEESFCAIRRFVAKRCSLITSLCLTWRTTNRSEDICCKLKSLMKRRKIHKIWEILSRVLQENHLVTLPRVCCRFMSGDWEGRADLFFFAVLCHVHAVRPFPPFSGSGSLPVSCDCWGFGVLAGSVPWDKCWQSRKPPCFWSTMSPPPRVFWMKCTTLPIPKKWTSWWMVSTLEILKTNCANKNDNKKISYHFNGCTVCILYLGVCAFTRENPLLPLCLCEWRFDEGANFWTVV